MFKVVLSGSKDKLKIKGKVIGNEENDTKENWKKTCIWNQYEKINFV